MFQAAPDCDEGEERHNDFPDNVEGGTHQKRKGKGEDFLRSRVVLSAPELAQMVYHLNFVLEGRNLWIAHLEEELGPDAVDRMRIRKKLEYLSDLETYGRERTTPLEGLQAVLGLGKGKKSQESGEAQLTVFHDAPEEEQETEGLRSAQCPPGLSTVNGTDHETGPATLALGNRVEEQERLIAELRQENQAYLDMNEHMRLQIEASSDMQAENTLLQNCVVEKTNRIVEMAAEIESLKSKSR